MLWGNTWSADASINLCDGFYFSQQGIIWAFLLSLAQTLLIIVFMSSKMKGQPWTLRTHQSGHSTLQGPSPVLSLLFDLQCKRVVTIILASFFVLRKCWEEKYYQVHNHAGNVVFCSVSDSYKYEQSKLECIIIVPIIRWTNSYFAS